MRVRTAAFASVVTVGMLLLGQAVASANVVWCLSDPPLQVVTPGGHYVMVNNQVYVPPTSVHLKSSVTDNALALPDGKGGTLITVRTYLPAGMARALVVSSDNRFNVSDSGSGVGGTTITTHLDVPTG